jgi:hypothetical protein
MSWREAPDGTSRTTWWKVPSGIRTVTRWSSAEAGIVRTVAEIAATDAIARST